MIKNEEDLEFSDEILKILLKDHSSNRNIIWATDNYKERGQGCQSDDSITIKNIRLFAQNKIIKRTEKSKMAQLQRVKSKAEVFTPSWICNKMVNNLDEIWFGRKYIFNRELEDGWEPIKDKIEFKDGYTWQDYVKLKVLEITCGEAPFLVSRYDATTGEYIELADRVGVLDRKLRVISENVQEKDNWFEWVKNAYKAVFGYEWQGDNLLIARKNLIYTFTDYYKDKFCENPPDDKVIEIAKIISWNLWQMDGLKYVIPNSCKKVSKMEISFFDYFEGTDEEEECPGCVKGKKNLHTGIYSRIMNWKTNKSIKFESGGKNMKFDFVIGNPPYQVESSGTKKADDSVYNYFMDAAYGISDKVEMITPSKFLFDNGNTPKDWRKKMLNDPHFKVLMYEANAKKIFPSTGFKGGVAIHYRDKNANFGAIGQFTDFSELNSILSKVRSKGEQSITDIIYNQNKFDLEALYKDYPELESKISSDGKEKRMTSGCLIYGCFKTEKTEDDDIQVLGLLNGREYRYLQRKYVEKGHPNLDLYKVIVPANNGSGALGETITTPLIGEPLIGEPLIGYTQTFISFGAEKTEEAANAILKYVKSKFARVLLGVKKITQNGKRDMWEFVPLQNFNEATEIDWSKSVHEIDLQLYEKYSLDEKEIEFIENHVQEMK